MCPSVIDKQMSYLHESKSIFIYGEVSFTEQYFDTTIS